MTSAPPARDDSADDPPAVAAEIAVMRRAWRTRLMLALATMAAIVAFFLIDLRDDPRLAESLAPIALIYVALAVAFVVAVRLATARQAAQIRERGAAAAPVRIKGRPT